MKRTDLFLRLIQDCKNSGDVKNNPVCVNNNTSNSSVLAEADYSALVSAFFIGNPFKRIKESKV